MADLSYTQRTLQALRDQGYVPGMVERHLARVGPHGIKRDLFGVFDIVAMLRGVELLGVQSTGPNGYSGHMKTIVHSEHIDNWISIPGLRAELWCWELRPRVAGQKVMEWTPRIIRITPELLAAERARRGPLDKPTGKEPGIPVYQRP